VEASDQDISAGKSGPIEESDESAARDTGAQDQDISAGKSGPTVEPDSDDSESSGD
jgi:hypothetical protein